MDWMDANQLGRRNLSPDAFKLSLGRRYNRTKKAVGSNLPQNRLKAQIDPLVTNTAANLAAEHSVSENTVKRAGKFADEVAKAPELQKAIMERRPNSFAGGFTIAGRRRTMEVVGISILAKIKLILACLPPPNR